jgi:amino acid transporter
MIDEYFLEHPQAKWALAAIAALYIWFLILVPLYFLLKKTDPDKDPPKGVTFFKLLIGLIPFVLVAYNYWKAINQPPPPPPPPPEMDWSEVKNALTGFNESLKKTREEIDSVRKEAFKPSVVYLPSPGK